MPKSKNIAAKDAKKQKLSPAERSQIAKDRWAKRKADAAMENVVVTINTMLEQEAAKDTPAPPQPPEQPPVTPESISPGMSGTPENLTPFRPTPSIMSVPYIPDAPAPQLTPVAPKKPKRYTGPKEFSVALRAAESRLAKAIQEHAEALGKYNSLQAEIPYLLGIIKSLKGEQPSPVPQSFVTPQFPSPMPQFQSQTYVDPLAAIQAAMAAPPVSRATGGTMQFGPEVLGSLEGPEDEDMDKFITGPAAGGPGWIGG